ncbi:MAG: TonB-dependent receptor [Methylophilus sp.]|nr:TonB-dependent receptor [Methylophilus sp.]
MKSVRFLILSLLLFNIAATRAEDSPIKIAALTENDYLDDVPQVLTISRLRQSSSDAPSASTIIDREMIRAAGIIDLPDIFRLVPGFYVGINAGFITNTNHTVSYHGFNDAYARRMQVLIDGRTVYEPLYGGVQWSELPITIEDIDRIEITRGPNAASYGANAFLGVINIITREATGSHLNRVSVNYGNGRKEVFYHYGSKINNLNYRISTGYKEDDGLSNRMDFKRTNLINARASYKISDVSNVEFQFGFASGEREEGNLDKDSLLMLPRTKDVYNHFELIKWNNQLSEDNSFYVQGYHALSQVDDDITSASLPLPIFPSIITLANDITFERYDIEAQQNININKNLRVIWGGSTRLDLLYSPFWIGNNKDNAFRLQRMFTQAEWSAHQNLLLNAGFMLEHNDFTGVDFSPRGSANIKLTPNQTIRLGFSQANRTPSYFEEKFRGSVTATTLIPNVSVLYQRYFDSGNLDPEKITSKEIGYLGQFSNFSIDAKLYDDEINHLIDSVTDTTFVAPPGYVLLTSGGQPVLPKTFINQGNVYMRGFETQMTWSMTDNTKLIGNYAYINITSSDEIDQKNRKDYRQSTPKNIASLLFTHRFNAQWDGSFAAYYTSAANGLGDGDFIKANARFDARLAKKFMLNHSDGEVSLNIQNITDEHDNEYADYNTLRRRAVLNVKLDF